MSRREKFTPEQVAEALRASGGLYSRAAERLLEATGGTCSPSTITRYVAHHRRLHRVLAEIAEVNLDSAEGRLLDEIKNGNLAAITFYLRTKGRRRGYPVAGNPGTQVDRPQGVPAGLNVPDKIEDAGEWSKQHGGKARRS